MAQYLRSPNTPSWHGAQLEKHRDNFIYTFFMGMKLVLRMGEGEVFTGFWLGVPNGRDHWEDLGVGGRITLRWTLGR